MREKKARRKIDVGKNPTLTQKGGKSLATYYKAIFSSVSLFYYFFDEKASDVEKASTYEF
jgi:hypothetical protein